ncbi:MAG: ATP-binding protein [Flavobacteriales bacterium]|nr:ATP-binding protein [Flavobacteriales bacterium]
MHHILKLIFEGEHQKLDFKYTISEMRKIAKTLSAFANTDGGRLLVGVKDNGKIKGCRPQEERHMLEFAADEYCSPKLNLEFHEWIVEGKNILELVVYEGRNKPYFAIDTDKKKIAYTRIHDEVLPMPTVLFKAVKSRKIKKVKTFKITETEKNILSFINENEHCELSDILSVSKVSRFRTEWILADLINFKLIEVLFVNNKWTFN